MGWVVYDEQYRMVKYHKKAATARAAVTRYRNELLRGGYPGYPKIQGCCTYRDYEGILMGLRGDALRMWQFVNSQTG